MLETLSHRALAALKTHGHGTFDVIANHMGEPAQRVRWALDHLRRSGHVCVAGHASPCGRGRPRAVFAARGMFVLQQLW